ncbi:MAG: hypothetical protein COX15_00010 [Candidatus Colwellbacteria bacterium CG23_combo_of_CG06-09_8_20_14_all_42_19]|uniref:Uncharacterized protein n=1 Tax=Candidatus Colwellbacteria bacterium CG23_combo_of_CG06-09_8_20_14_all_42_19 TaxID=1974541 RepID=A0A2H0AMR8_9BACT|nr:MAG: hypothetical protein COX15_00010 [Candidatus Colwellbacteria bacterium CG23_combo_of_CG06-09_8_20_14_all_42_19]
MAQYTRSVNDQFLRNNLTVGWPWRMLIFTVVIFLIALLSYLGLAFGYKPYLQSSIAEVESELNSLSLQVESESQKKFIQFYSQVANLKTILNKHVAASKLFPLLEAQTHQKVVYSSVNVLVQEKTLKIEGLAESYEVLAAQLALYGQAPWVEKVILDNSSLADKKIKFSARIIIKNETINL